MSLTTVRAINPMPREISRLAELAAAVREYRTTDAMKAMLLLLEAIDAQVLGGLRNVDAEHLQFHQGKLKQLSALMSLLRGEPSDGVA
jgi:hypothetical protein